MEGDHGRGSRASEGAGLVSEMQRGTLERKGSLEVDLKSEDPEVSHPGWHNTANPPSILVFLFACARLFCMCRGAVRGGALKSASSAVPLYIFYVRKYFQSLAPYLSCNYIQLH